MGLNQTLHVSQRLIPLYPFQEEIPSPPLDNLSPSSKIDETQTCIAAALEAYSQGLLCERYTTDGRIWTITSPDDIPPLIRKGFTLQNNGEISYLTLGLPGGAPKQSTDGPRTTLSEEVAYLERLRKQPLDKAQYCKAFEDVYKKLLVGKDLYKTVSRDTFEKLRALVEENKECLDTKIFVNLITKICLQIWTQNFESSVAFDNSSSLKKWSRLIRDIFNNGDFKYLIHLDKIHILNLLARVMFFDIGKAIINILNSLENKKNQRAEFLDSIVQVFQILLTFYLRRAEMSEFASSVVWNQTKSGLSIQDLLALMEPGKERDPVMLIGAALERMLLNESAVELNVLELIRQFVLLTIIENGVHFYESSKFYTGMLEIYFKAKLALVLEKIESGQPFDTDLMTTANEYVEFTSHCSTIPDGLAGVGLSLYRFGATKDVVNKIDFEKLIEEMQNQRLKKIFVDLIVTGLCSHEKYANAIKFLDRPKISELKKEDDFLSLIYLLAKFKTSEGSGFSSEDLKHIDEIDSRIIRSQCNNDLNYYRMKYYITLLYICCNNQKMAQQHFTQLMTFIEGPFDIICADTISMMFLIDNFRDTFVSNNSNYENTEALEHVERYYKQLSNITPGLKKYLDTRLLKLFISLCYVAGKTEFFAKKDEYLAIKAAYDPNYKNYLIYLQENPHDPECEKIKMLGKLTDLTTANEVDNLIAEQTKRECKQIIETEQKISENKGKGRAQVVPAEETVPAYLQMKDGKQLSLKLCKSFTEGRTYYVYCEEEALEESGMRIEAFKYQLYTQPGFAKSKGKNGFKFLGDGVFEVKINDDSRILGFETQATHYVNGKSEGQVSILYFNKYVEHAHDTALFTQALKEQAKEAKRLSVERVA